MRPMKRRCSIGISICKLHIMLSLLQMLLTFKKQAYSLTTAWIAAGAGTPERGCMTGHCPLPLEKGGQRRHKCPLHNSIVGNFRDAGERWNHGGIPLPLERRQQERRCLFITASQGILWFIKISLIQIYCSCSRTHKIQNGFYNFCYYFCGQHCCCRKSIIGNDFYFL